MLSVVDAQECCPDLPQDGVLITQLLGVLAASGSQLPLQGLPCPKESRLTQGHWHFVEQPVSSGQGV